MPTHDRGRMFKNVLVPQPNHPLAGRRWFSKILESAGLAQSTAYEALVARARSAIAPAAAALGPRERPPAKTKRGMRRTADDDGFVKKDPAERLVSEEHNRGAHIEQAICADFPFLGDRYELPKTVKLPSQPCFQWKVSSWLNGGRGKYERSRQ